MASGSSSRGLVLLLLTSGFLIAGLVFDYMPMIIDDYIKRTIELATNEEILSFWSRPPVDVHSYYWLYEVANAEQFQAGDRVQVRKVGPFQFGTRLEKRIIELSANKYRITYNSTRISRLNDSFAGNERLDEQLTLLNPIYASLTEGARFHAANLDAQQASMVLASVNRLAERFNESLFMNVSARDALVGRPAPIVTKMRKLAETFGLDQQVPDLVPGGKFGYVALANGTWSGPFEIYTGYQETSKSLGELISYQGRRRLSHFEGRCNRLQASAGELRPMPVDGARLLEMFAPNFCRIVHLRPTGSHKLREGLAYSYVLAAEDLLSAQANPDNRCFCVNGSAAAGQQQPARQDYCSLSGAIELAPCSYGAPLVLTVSNIAPDPAIAGSIQNWEPELVRGELEHLATNDQAQLLILRRFGVPVFADLTMTLFAKVTRDPRFRHTANVPEASYVPLVTIRETATIPQRFAQIMVNLESFLALTYHIKVVMYLSSLVLLCWLAAYYYCATSQADRVVPASRPQSGDRGADGLASGQAAPSRPPREPADDGGGPPASSSPPPPPQQQPPPPPPSSSQGAIVAATTASGALGQPLSAKLVEEAAASAAAAGQSADKQQADTASSERANSADSSRSQPPSPRASRLTSLETTIGAASSQDDPAAAPPAAGARQPGERRQEAGAAGPEAAGVANVARAGESGPPAPNGATNGGGARIFSKVDEQLSRAADKQRQLAATTAAPAAAGVVNLPDAPDEAQQQQQQQHEGARGLAARKRSRKGWFMNVYSGFVRMLNGLRATISEAGQLDAGDQPADYQDKQLEMLAGRIDNWYTSPAPSAASPDGGAGGESPRPVTRSARLQPTEGPEVGEQATGETRGPDGRDKQRVQPAAGAETRAGSDERPVAQTGQLGAAAAASATTTPARPLAALEASADGTRDASAASQGSASSTRNKEREDKQQLASGGAGGKTIARPGEQRNKSPRPSAGEPGRELVEHESGAADDSGRPAGANSPGSASATPATTEPEPASSSKDQNTASMSSRSATSDELGPGDDLELEANCKASALEQIEASLRAEAATAAATVAAAAADERRPTEASGGQLIDSPDNGPAGRPIMINSSTSFDSVINLAPGGTNNTTSERVTGGRPRGSDCGPGGAGANQSEAPASEPGAPDQFDESSSRVGSPMNSPDHSSGRSASGRLAASGERLGVARADDTGGPVAAAAGADGPEASGIAARLAASNDSLNVDDAGGRLFAGSTAAAAAAAISSTASGADDSRRQAADKKEDNGLFEGGNLYSRNGISENKPLQLIGAPPSPPPPTTTTTTATTTMAMVTTRGRASSSLKSPPWSGAPARPAASLATQVHGGGSRAATPTKLQPADRPDGQSSPPKHRIKARPTGGGGGETGIGLGAPLATPGRSPAIQLINANGAKSAAGGNNGNNNILNGKIMFQQQQRAMQDSLSTVIV